VGALHFIGREVHERGQKVCEPARACAGGLGAWTAYILKQGALHAYLMRAESIQVLASVYHLRTGHWKQPFFYACSLQETARARLPIQTLPRACLECGHECTDPSKPARSSSTQRRSQGTSASILACPSACSGAAYMQHIRMIPPRRSPSPQLLAAMHDAFAVPQKCNAMLTW